MKLNELLQKPKWKRRLPSDKRNGTRYAEFTQDDFMDELHPTSHKINSEVYKSLRPKFKINKETNKQELIGYDDVERVSWSLEEICLRTCTTHCAGGDVWFGNEGEEADGEIIKMYKSHWNMSGMKHAIQMWLHDAFACGDSAIYLYKENDKISYKIFSYLNGDVINMPYKDTFVRKFEVGNQTLIEVYDNTTVSTYIQTEDNSSIDKLKRILGRAFGANLGVTEDGWKCIETRNHGSIGNPVTYIRIKDVVWGNGVPIRERIEKIVSAWGDNNNYFAFPIFYFSGNAIKLPDMGVAGKAIGFKNTDSKAGIISPPDASTSFLLDLEKNLKAWADACGVTIIDPKDLKGGSQASGAYLRNLYFTSVIWAQLTISKLRPDINNVIWSFARHVGQIEGSTSKYNSMKMSWVLEPFVPTNKMEDVTIINQCVSAGTTSIETGAEEIAHNNPFEMDRLRRQRKEVANAKKTEEVKKVEDTENTTDKEEQDDGSIDADNNTKKPK